MTEGIRWIREKDVVDLMDLPRAMDAVEEALRLQSAGEAQDMAKTHVRWGANTLHAIGASLEGAGLVGTKTWAYTTGGASPLVILWHADDGSIAAIIEAFALGQLRTASASALATRHLAHEDADTLAMIGTGKQALGQVAAVLAVRPITRIRVFSPTEDHRVAFARRLRETWPGISVDAVPSVAAAVEQAAVVTTATRARTPFLEAEYVASGAHLNAVGAITPERQELTHDIVARCTPVVVDNPSAARELATELAGAFEPDGQGTVRSLSGVVSEGSYRPVDADLTLFKAMGIGLSDVALGHHLLRSAEKAGLGRVIPSPEHTAIAFGPAGVGD